VKIHCIILITLAPWDRIPIVSRIYSSLTVLSCVDLVRSPTQAVLYNAQKFALNRTLYTDNQWGRRGLTMAGR